MPVAGYIAVFFVLISGCTQGVLAKEDGVPDRRVGGGTRLEFPGKLPHASNRNASRPSLAKKVVEVGVKIVSSTHL